MDRGLCILLIVLRLVHKFVCHFVPCDQVFLTRRSILSNCSCMLLFFKNTPCNSPGEILLIAPAGFLGLDTVVTLAYRWQLDSSIPYRISWDQESMRRSMHLPY